MTFPVVSDDEFPTMATVRQLFESAPPIDVEKQIEAGLAQTPIAPGERIAVATGSRGIVEVGRAVKAVVAHLERRGARPFILPAMGSHGGATPEGQTEVLATYGITEESCGAPILASMETVRLGETENGTPVHCARAALDADGIVLINRIKPHTDYAGPLGSGLLKMVAIGLGKQDGAIAIHRRGARVGMENAVYEVSRFLLDRIKVRAGVALIENAVHDLSHVEVVRKDDLEKREPALLTMSRERMAQLPFQDIDLLIVDRMGKDISGTGIDPNVIGRRAFGYSSRLSDVPRERPHIRRIFVRDLTADTHGNAVGIGLVDFATDRLLAAVDRKTTLANALTAIAIQSVKMPMAFADDRLAIGVALASLALEDPRTARVVRIRDSLSLQTIEASPGCLDEKAVGASDRLEVVTPARPMKFDENRNLLPIGA